MGNKGNGQQTAAVAGGCDPGMELELVLRCQVPGQLLTPARKHGFFSLP